MITRGLGFFLSALTLLAQPDMTRIGEGSRLAETVMNAPNSPAAQAALRELEASRDAGILEGAVFVFQRTYIKSLMLGREEQRANELARRYLPRAKGLNPKLDEAWVFPQPDPKMAGILAPGYVPPPGPPVPMDFPLLRPREIAGLPSEIAAILERRGCRIPQSLGPGVTNAIQGEFLEAGRRTWAVLCSRDGFGTILVFRSNNDTQPMELARRADSGWKPGGGRTGYANQLTAAGRTRILEHYRDPQGPRPPPIEHEGIDDSILDKASTVHYFYQGKWLELMGAD